MQRQVLPAVHLHTHSNRLSAVCDTPHAFVTCPINVSGMTHPYPSLDRFPPVTLHRTPTRHTERLTDSHLWHFTARQNAMQKAAVVPARMPNRLMSTTQAHPCHTPPQDNIGSERQQHVLQPATHAKPHDRYRHRGTESDIHRYLFPIGRGDGIPKGRGEGIHMLANFTQARFARSDFLES